MNAIRNICFAILFAAPFLGCGRQETKQAQTLPKKKASPKNLPTPPAVKSDTTLAFLEGDWETHEMRCDDCLKHRADVYLRMRIKNNVVEFLDEGKTDTIRYDRDRNRFLFTRNGMIRVDDANTFTYDTDVHFDGASYTFSRITR